MEDTGRFVWEGDFGFWSLPDLQDLRTPLEGLHTEEYSTVLQEMARLRDAASKHPFVEVLDEGAKD